MKFGMFYELVAPPPFDAEAVRRTYHEALAQIVLAEQMGFEYVWVTEHHFTERFSYSAAPDVFLGAVARETSTIRIGQAVSVLTVNHPVHVAERAAVLDILSDGRLEFGTGRGSSEAELGGFQIDPDDSRPMWEEALDMIIAMWASDTFEWKGRYYELPPRNVIPKPVQEPHPPLWLATVSPPSFELAAQRGLGALCFSLSAPGQSAEAIKAYRRGIESAEPASGMINNQVAAFTVALCAESDEEARKRGAFAASVYGNWATLLYKRWSASEAGWRPWFGRDLPDIEPDEDEVGSLVESGAVCLGDPERCIRTIKQWEELGVDQIMCLMQGAKVSHESVMESIRLFGEHVIPHFRNGSTA